MDENYDSQYLRARKRKFSLEEFLDGLRRKHVIKAILKYKAVNILEIGCGPTPIFPFLDKFQNYVIVERSKVFSENALNLSNKYAKGNITIINGKLEDVKDRIPRLKYDVIVISSVLHEVENSAEILSILRTFCGSSTVVVAIVPNADSIHRLLAVESNLIRSKYDDSDTDRIYNRKAHYDEKSFRLLFEKNGYDVINVYTFFIKFLSNAQLEAVLSKGILSYEVLYGFEKLSSYLPRYGAEIFLEARIAGNNLKLRGETKNEN